MATAALFTLFFFFILSVFGPCAHSHDGMSKLKKTKQKQTKQTGVVVAMVAEDKSMVVCGGWGWGGAGSTQKLTEKQWQTMKNKVNQTDKELLHGE